MTLRPHSGWTAGHLFYLALLFHFQSELCSRRTGLSTGRSSRVPQDVALEALSKPDLCVFIVPPRARIPSAGSFHCSETGLGFEVSAAVIIEYEYGSWAESLSPSARQEWMVAGPLFHIRAEPDTVRAVHLPHFVCLADGTDESLCHIAHFEAGRMTLESPTRINNFFAVLENPSFSQLGVLWRKIRSTIKFIPIHSLVLIFRMLSAADVTLHLYLIPNDHSLRKVKHNPIYTAFLLPRWPTLFSQPLLSLLQQLHFCYRSPGEQQSYIEIYTKELEKEIRLHVNGQDDGSLVWEALVRPGRITLVSPIGAAFVVKHRRQLRARMGQIQPVLVRLREAQLLSSEEEEEVRSERTSRMRNDALLQLVERKGAQAQEELYQTLREMDPYLVQDLEQSS
uniref:Caspase recruitment domain family member 10 n=1 Tax=Gopherus agassizii TaxID=38772 RepID=A0A452ILX8_9SAUR